MADLPPIKNMSQVITPSYSMHLTDFAPEFQNSQIRITNTISWYLARITNSYLLSLVSSW